MKLTQRELVSVLHTFFLFLVIRPKVKEAILLKFKIHPYTIGVVRASMVKSTFDFIKKTGILDPSITYPEIQKRLCESKVGYFYEMV